jgi:hypothetical protein
MTEIPTRLSDTFESEAFKKTLESWNFTVAGNTALEDAFWKKADKRIKKLLKGSSDDDYMAREVVSDALSNAVSAIDFENSSGGYIANELDMNDDIDERQARSLDFHEKEVMLSSQLSEGIEDPFEQFALNRYVPVDTPTKVEITLARIAATKSDLINFDNFTKENQGKVFITLGIRALHAGKFSDAGITLKKDHIYVPIVEASTHFAYFNYLDDTTEIIEDPTYNIDMRDIDGGVQVKETPRLLRTGELWKAARNRKMVWSLGQVPQSPLFYEAEIGSPNYQENLDFFERRIEAIRVLGEIAASAE